MKNKDYKIKVLIEAINQLWYHDLITLETYAYCLSEVKVIAEDFEMPEK